MKIIFLLALATFGISHSKTIHAKLGSFNTPQLLKQGDGCTCGQQQTSRIIGGTNASRGDFPWRVRICSARRGSSGCSSCGATVIAPQWLLTAAHCFPDLGSRGYETKVYYGDTKSQSRNVVTAEKVFPHEKYTTLASGNSQNDIALVKLGADLPFEDPNIPVGPACLPYPWVGKEFTGKVVASGWGKTKGRDAGSSASTLQTAVLDMILNADCKKNYDRTITNTKVCTYTAGKSVCQGDSGGSIDYESEGSFYAFGAVSYGPQYCDKHGVFTRVSEYLEWIQNKTETTYCKP